MDHAASARGFVAGAAAAGLYTTALSLLPADRSPCSEGLARKS